MKEQGALGQHLPWGHRPGLELGLNQEAPGGHLDTRNGVDQTGVVGWGQRVTGARNGRHHSTNTLQGFGGTVRGKVLHHSECMPEDIHLGLIPKKT